MWLRHNQKRGMINMASRKDYIFFATFFREHHFKETEALKKVCAFFEKDNPNFDEKRFMEEVLR